MRDQHACVKRLAAYHVRLALLLTTVLAPACPLYGQTYFRSDALFLDQLNSDQKVLSQSTSGGDSAVLFSDSVNLKMEAGAEFALGRFLDPITVCELSYFGLHHWSENAAVTPQPGNTLDAPFSINGAFLDDFIDASQQGFSFTSEIHDVQLNLRRQLTRPIWFTLGIRYVDYDQSLNFFSVDNSAGQEVGQYNVNTDNQMLGLQVGGDANYLLTSWLEMSAILMTGVFINWVDQDTLLINNNAVFAQGGKSDTGLSGLIDASLRFTCTRGNLRAFAGYRVFILSGMALAADQFDFSINEDPAAVIGNVNHQGTSILHGPFVGLIYTLP